MRQAGHSASVFPIRPTNTADVTFAAPGLVTLGVVAEDDDGASSAADSLPRLVTDNAECTRTQGFWAHRVSTSGTHQIDDATLALAHDEPED